MFYYCFSEPGEWRDEWFFSPGYRDLEPWLNDHVLAALKESLSDSKNRSWSITVGKLNIPAKGHIIWSFKEVIIAKTKCKHDAIQVSEEQVNGDLRITLSLQ